MGGGEGVMSGYLEINALKRCIPSFKDLEFHALHTEDVSRWLIK